jgi:hypothetical protein
VTVYVVCAAVGVIGTVVGSGGERWADNYSGDGSGRRRGPKGRYKPKKHKNCGDVCAETSS